MVKNKKGTILFLTFILVMGLAIVVGSTTYLAVLRVRDIGGEMDYLNAYYYAQAGFAKAIWYLKNPGVLPGRGRKWRSTNVVEPFGGGSYSITVKNSHTPLEVTIISQGTVRNTSRTIQADYYTYPPAFNFALYSLAKVSLESSSSYLAPTLVGGSIDPGNISLLADNDVFINKNAKVSFGYYAYVTTGHKVTGEGTYSLGPAPTPFPAFPTLNATYYNNQIAIAKTKTAGNKEYIGTLDLTGGTVYVNGNVIVRKSVKGPGDLVVTGTIYIWDSANISSRIRFIADKDVTIEDGTNVSDCDVFYSNTNITLISGFSETSSISLLCPKTVNIKSGSTVYGIIYAGSATIEATSHLFGSAMLGNYGAYNHLRNRGWIYYNDYYLPDTPPPGIPGAYTLIPGTWKEF
jgi:hypothetical protein